jgi:hypothetical protein
MIQTLKTLGNKIWWVTAIMISALYILCYGIMEAACRKWTYIITIS